MRTQTKPHTSTPVSHRRTNENLFKQKTEALQAAAEYDRCGNTVQANRARTVAERATVELFNLNTGLVASLATVFRTEGADDAYEEYLDAGKLALLTALNTWDPNRAPLSVWARGPITKAIIAQVGQLDLGVTRYAFAARAAVTAARSDLAEILGRLPTPEEISDATGLTRSLVDDICFAEQRKAGSTSLDQRVGEDGSSETLGQRVRLPDTTDTSPDLGERLWNLNLTSPPCGLGEWAWIRQSGLLGFPPEDLTEIARCASLSGEAVRKAVKPYRTWLDELDLDGLITADLDLDPQELVADLLFWFHPEPDPMGEQLSLGEGFNVATVTVTDDSVEPEPETVSDTVVSEDQLTLF
jgi:DNA-directed RNA polymerase specialized sigma subunit